MEKLGVPRKLIKLTIEIRVKVKIQGQLSDAFGINSGFNQGDVVPTILFNFRLKRIIRRISIYPAGSIFNARF